MDSRCGFTDENDDESLFGGYSFSNIVVDELKKFVRNDNNDDDIKKKGTWENYYVQEEEGEEEGEDLTEALLIQMGYGKTGPPKHDPPPTPLPSDKLKSAMKGSAKKEGVEDKERKVSWAEDVYDPTPSSDSHFASNRTGRHKNESKKSGKNRQKGGGKGLGGGELGGLWDGAKGGKDKDKKDKKRGGGGGAKSSKNIRIRSK